MVWKDNVLWRVVEPTAPEAEAKYRVVDAVEGYAVRPIEEAWVVDEDTRKAARLTVYRVNTLEEEVLAIREDEYEAELL